MSIYNKHTTDKLTKSVSFPQSLDYVDRVTTNQPGKTKSTFLLEDTAQSGVTLESILIIRTSITPVACRS